MAPESTVSLHGKAHRIPLSAGSALSFVCLLAAAMVAWAFLSSTQVAITPTQLLTTAVAGTESNAHPAEINRTLSEIAKAGQAPAELDQRRPLWLRIDLPDSVRTTPAILELKLIRFDKPRFWMVHKDQYGVTTYREIQPLLEPVRSASKGGFSVPIEATPDGSAVIATLRSYMPDPPKALLWTVDEYATSERAFERQGGAVFGAILILAAFSAIVALLNRELTFLLFSGWLITSLRVAAINAGWDRHWIQLELDNDAYLALLRISIAAYGFFTVSLFRELLLNRILNPIVAKYFELLQHTFLIFVLAAPFFDHIQYLKVFWAFAAIGLGTLTLQIFASLFIYRTRLVGWYALSWGCMIVGMASEIGAQSGVVQYPSWLNSQTATVVSALMMGLALADRLRSERDERVAAQARSVKYLKKYEENFNSMPIGLFGLSVSGSIRLMNPAFRGMFDLKDVQQDDTVSIDDLLGIGSFQRLVDAAAQGVLDVEIGTTTNNSEPRWYLARVTLNDQTIEGSIQDVTLRKAAESKLKHLVDHDSLTGLLNRRGLDVALLEALTPTEAYRSCALAYVDLDRFKLINDLHGHGAGDALLLQAAQRIQLAVRGHDTVARIADSFVVIFFDCPEHAIGALSERIREIICERPFTLDDIELNMTASIGVVSIDSTMKSVDALAAADRACSEAKSRGRNCVVRLTDQDTALRSHLEELQVVADLQQHVPTERCFLEFQPIVALQSSVSSLCYEVLIRMRGDQGQVVPPSRFIGAAERNGLMSQIDRWVLRSTLEWLDNHPEHRNRLGFASINISGASLNDNRFVDDAFSMIAEHPLAMPKLCFEITESVALHDLGSTRRFVDRVRMYGSKLALDDFGAGYTSFNYLKEIPADFIKIDGSFVKDINRNPGNYAITRTIVDLTHELGMRSIAEWAETPDTIAALIELGVDYGQGFGLVRPTAAEIVSASVSGAALIKDPKVLALLNDRSRWQSAPRTGPRLQRKTA
jgi:diguanylate cyclase (GGDEF)-like protein